MIARTFSVLFSVSLLALACGSDDTEDGSSSGNGTSGGASSGFGGGSGVGDPSALIGPACATSNANGVAEPMSLAFMFDRSGSMKFNPSPNLKWDKVVEGLSAFFKDDASTNLSASLDVFPAGENQQCSVDRYKSPVVGMTALPDAKSVLVNALHAPANQPDKDFDTPTRPALEGAIAFAKTVKAQGKKVAVVLVTDGKPQSRDCNTNQVSDVAAAAAKGVADGIKTYVVGVGTDQDLRNNLRDMAVGGGTGDATMVSDADPNKITQDFVAALGVIRAENRSCDYPLPKPPSGEQLDTGRVNVQYTAGGSLKTLTYSRDCASGVGWTYDNAGAPTKITICKSSCDTLLADAAGKISIVFGCTTVNSAAK